MFESPAPTIAWRVLAALAFIFVGIVKRDLGRENAESYEAFTVNDDFSGTCRRMAPLEVLNP
jgi:hypothetical protein